MVGEDGIPAASASEEAPDARSGAHLLRFSPGDSRVRRACPKKRQGRAFQSAPCGGDPLRIGGGAGVSHVLFAGERSPR
jgi:hypothetical protein